MVAAVTISGCDREQRQLNKNEHGGEVSVKKVISRSAEMLISS